jgi:hydrogenase maturation protease
MNSEMNTGMRTIVVGIGNPILGDDGVGIHIIRALRLNRHLPPDIKIDEAQTGGLNLLDLITGFDYAILVDAVSLSGYVHGEISRFDLFDLPTVHSQNPHDVSLLEALSMAEVLGHTSIPRNITIIGVNLEQIPREFSENVSTSIRKCIPKAVNLILHEIQEIKKQEENLEINT